MAAAGLIATREELKVLFDDLARTLQALDLKADIVMVGGSWLLWHSQRAATRDVDSARRFDEDLTDAIQIVASTHDLSKTWLNDAAAAYWPANANLDDSAVAYERDALTVRTPSPDVIFAMKLYRAHPQDREDMVSLWPMCSFRRPKDAVAAFRAGYPHAPDDEYLTRYVAEIARDTT